MSIINVTPDSFSEPSGRTDPDRAVARALLAVAEGADLLDIGGESTRPGAVPVDAATERARVLPVIEALVARTDVPLSIDTTKASVAEAALRAGCALVNDVSGLHADPEMAGVVTRFGVPLVAMANLRGIHFDDVIAGVGARFSASLAIAAAAGIARERVILDPGFGFGPAPAQNLEMVRRLGELHAFGRPLLLGVSRKSTLGRVLDLPVEQRLEGTAAAVTLGIAAGVAIVRVHDTRAIGRVARMADAIVRGWVPPADATQARQTGTS